MDVEQFAPELKRLSDLDRTIDDNLAAIRTKESPPERSIFQAIDAVSQAIRALCVTGTDDILRAIAQEVERGVRDGSEDWQTVLVTGLLENLQNRSYRYPEIARFMRQLGPASRDACAAWDKFTGAKTPGL